MTTYTYEHKYRLASQFARRFQNEKRERAEKDTFWNEFFAIFGLDRFRTATTEYAVKHRNGHTKFADVFWAGRLLCEHKSAGKDLDAAFEQAMGYVEEIRRHNPDDVPRHIIVSDFATMKLYDLKDGTDVFFPLSDLPEHIKLRHFDFMDGITHELRQAQEQANIEAAAAVGSLYQAFRADGSYDEHSLKQFLIRLLFCFFADDTLIFEPNQFEGYLKKYTREDGEDIGGTLNRLFAVLNTPPERRAQNMNTELRAFPYVNGKLFEEQLGEFYFNAELRELLLQCSARDWAKISPEIFGNLFQSVMDNVERRELGAHYTEEGNILKVIDGLFMDNLRERFQTACKVSGKAKRTAAIHELHQEIGRLQFLDPACGCGNFLVVAYRELRKLEDDIIGELFAEGQLLDISTMLQTHIGQFHGIEIDEYPAQIAKVAMWLTDHQCNLRTAERFGQTRPSIPLTDSAEIINANSLHTEWPQADYIFGNPPFVGKQYQTPAQKADIQMICGIIKGFGILDYVANWYVKAARIIAQNHNVQAAFVSTNSITQGEQASVLWQYLFKQDIEIHFAHRTFQWTSQASGKAAVHCVIVGFRRPEKHSGEKYLFEYPDIKELPEKHTASNINQYLTDAPSIIINKQRKQICNELPMAFGSMPNDGGNLLLSTAEKQALITAEPLAAQYIRPFFGSEEFLNDKERWCLWFHGISETRLHHDLKQMPQTAQRIESVRQKRSESDRATTKELAATPHLFGEIRQPASGNYLIIPRVSSESRAFIPIGYVDCNTINSDANFMLPNATPYHFGILCSTMHNAFMRAVAGRLESRYRYSNTIVYNNFPFPFAPQSEGRPAPAAEQKHRAAIEAAAQTVLDARAFYRREAEQEGLPPPSLADLYRPDAPFTRLHQAHRALDKAVDAAYGYKGGHDDGSRTAFLFALYQKAAAEADKR
ncbi:DNA methyltransferase [Neisseria sp. P0009.S008]|uniref:DNA methyltransferase n=1 Tax=unclassified Neisseria TaxID=2623750 RepID=UPI003F808E48